MTAPMTRAPSPSADAPTCDYAACHDPATSSAGGWSFCDRHLEHDAAVRAGDEPPYGEQVPEGYTVDHADECGTEAGYQRHRRAGEDACEPCRRGEYEAHVMRKTGQTLGAPRSTAAISAIRELPTRALTEHPANVRSDLGDLTDMEASVRAQGILQPLLVTRGDRGVYVVIAGHRRLAAALRAGGARVPVVLRERLVGTDAIEAMLVENLQRANLDPIDEAKAYQQLVAAGRTQAEIARAVGKNQGHISQRLALLHLTPAEQAAVRRKEITVADAYRAGRARSENRMDGEQRRPKPRKVPHFVITHPQAEAAASACEHETTLKLGVACGPCWERAIRNDERRRAARLVSVPA